jgi:hypothetical protein
VKATPGISTQASIDARPETTPHLRGWVNAPQRPRAEGESNLGKELIWAFSIGTAGEI